MTPYIANDNDVTLFAETNFRNQRKRFGIKRRDRRSHMYIIGKTGMGKSTLLENMIYSDLQKGEGLAVIDPHGDLAMRIQRLIPQERQADLIYFDPADMHNPLGFNLLESSRREHHQLLASGLVSVFKKIWRDSWGPRTEYILRNTILALLDVPQATLMDLPKMLNDKEYRAAVLTLMVDEQVKDFWVNEYATYTARFRSEAIAPIQNKVGQFLTNRLIRGVISQKQSSFDIRKLMDEGKILIANLAKGKIGEDVSNLLGAMLLTRIELAALSRADIPEGCRRDFYVYADEFYNFTTASFANVLAEARKYRLNLILANQYIEQLEEKLRAAIFGNVGTLISFRLGADDAEYVAREFYPVFSETDLIDLPQYHIDVKLMIDGVSQSPFSAVTLPPTLGTLSF
jgi:type IV secretory pathway TraG/TraD family ATPase VirD4